MDSDRFYVSVTPSVKTVMAGRPDSAREVVRTCGRREREVTWLEGRLGEAY
jgi:hypothetical protein